MFQRLNAGLCAAALGLSAMTLLIVPLLLLPPAPLMAAALAIAAALLTPFHAALLHEAIHGKLMKEERANRMAGRLLAICFGVAFEVVRYGHLAHHRFNRHALDRPDVLQTDATLRARLGYFANLLGGVYAIELLSTLMSLLPRRVLIARIGRLAKGDEPSALAVIRGMQRAVADARLTRARVDSLAVLALYGVAFWLYGPAWPLLLASILIRGLIISLFDNAPHYGTPPVTRAPVFNLSLPGWARALMLNQNLHGLHHRRPGLPWHTLPAAFAADRTGYDGSFATAVLIQFNGPQPARQASDFEAIS